MSEKMKDWITNSGLRAVILLVNKGSHHCGYVEINEGHPLFKKNYSENCCPQLPEETEIGNRGIIPLMCMDKDQEMLSPDCYFNVHGGITFAGDFKHESDGWWFGYDCAHCGDETRSAHSMKFNGDIWRDEEYCTTECESLAEQLAGLSNENCNK